MGNKGERSNGQAKVVLAHRKDSMKLRIGTQAAKIRSTCMLCDEKKSCFFVNVREPAKKRIYVCAECIVGVVETVEKKGIEDESSKGEFLPLVLADAAVGATDVAGDDDGAGVESGGAVILPGTEKRAGATSVPSVKAKRPRKK